MTTTTIEAEQTKTVDMTPSQLLQKECVGSRLAFAWFSTSRRVDKRDKAAMATSTNTSVDGFSASKRLMDSKHPTIKRANELRRRIESVWRGMSLPLAGCAADDCTRVEPGVRLMDVTNVERFDGVMQAFEPEAVALETALNTDLPDIKRMDRERLGDLYREDDYPKELHLRFSWGWTSVEIPSVVERIPRLRARAQEQLDAQLSATLDMAVTSLLEEFLGVIQAWTAALSPVVRLKPPAGHPLARLADAELREQKTHETHPDEVQPGHVQALVRYQQNKTSHEEWLPQMTPAELATLRPTQIGNERRVFRDSTIVGMSDFLSNFSNVQNLLQKSVPDSAARIGELVDRARTHLAQCHSPEAAANELRVSAVFRQQTHAIMAELSTRVKSEIRTATTKRRNIIQEE